MQLPPLFARLLGGPGSFRLDVATSMAAGVLSRLITLASLPAIAHYYSPADLGLWAIVLSLTTYLIPLATLRYDIAVVIAPTARMARALVAAVALSLAVLAVLLFVLVPFLPVRFWEAVSGLPETSQDLLAVMPLLLVLSGGQLMLQSLTTRQRRFGALGVSQMVQAVATTAATLGLLWVYPASGRTAAAGAIIGLAMAVAVLLFGARAEAAKLAGLRWSTLYHAARKYKVYPAYLLPYSLSAGLAERVMQVVLVSAYSVGTLGAFYVARQLLVAPATLLANTLRQVMFAHSARNVDLAVHKMRIARIVALMIDILGPAVAFSLFWLSPLLSMMLPASWAHVGDFAWWIIFPSSLLMIAGCFDRMLDVLGRQRLSVFLQVSADVLLICAVLVAPRLGLGEMGMVAVISLTNALSYAIWLLVFFNLVGFGGAEVVGMAGRAALHVLIWGLCQMGAMFLIAHVLAGMIVGSLILAAGLAFAAYRFIDGYQKDGTIQ